jgi:hypothetical protein
LLTRSEPVQLMAELTLIIIDLAAGPRSTSARNRVPCRVNSPIGVDFVGVSSCGLFYLGMRAGAVDHQDQTFCHPPQRPLVESIEQAWMLTNEEVLPE